MMVWWYRARFGCHPGKEMSIRGPGGRHLRRTICVGPGHTDGSLPYAKDRQRALPVARIEARRQRRGVHGF
jgi:hypothetical protein